MIFKKNIDLCIVIPKEATDREQFAANELQSYLFRIFGETFPICTTEDETHAYKMLIGCPRRNAITANYISVALFDETVPGPEGFLIQSFEDAIVLAGSSTYPNDLERGTIYAVYEFLERFLGCSLSAYTKQDVAGGEYVPTLERIDLSDIFYAKAKADLPYRAACVQNSSHGKGREIKLIYAFLDWLCKNRYNYFYTWNSVYEEFKKSGVVAEATKRGILFKVGHHDAVDTLLPPRGNAYFPEHYYETHPEYYRLQEDGTHFEIVSHWGQMALCSRNDEMIAQLSENLISWLNQNPLVKIYSLLPKDGRAPQCLCEKCKGHTKSENYAYMINELAKRVGKVHPDVTVNMMAYSDLWTPPENVHLEPNVTVTEATWNRSTNWTPEWCDTRPWDCSGLRLVGKPDGSCLTDSRYEKNLLGWQAAGAKVSYYDYFMGVYPARQRYIPMADEMQAMCKRFIEKDIEGTETQIEVFNHWNHIFNFYTYGRTSYDSDLSMEDNLKRFCIIFGKGASYIADNIRHAENVLDGQSDIMSAGIYLMQHINKDYMYDNFEKALAAADTACSRNNIRLMRMAFRYSDIECLEDYKADESGYKAIKVYQIPERGELFYMRDHFDSYISGDGFGIAIPVQGEEASFEPDYWYFFE